jgi:type IX secretion system PorP/SprF family membrane protein
MKKFLLIFFILINYYCKAQVTQVFNHFYNNPYLYNPAFAGNEERPSLFINHRQQWLGIEGAPSLSHLSFHSPVGFRSFAFGAQLSTDKRSLLSHNSFLLTVAYHLNISRVSNLSFGISGGVRQNRLDFSEVPNPNDPALQKNLINNMYLDAQTGINYSYKKFNLGFSLPHIITSKNLDHLESERTSISPLNAYNVMANYKYAVSKDLEFAPYVVYRKVPEGISFTETVALIFIKDMVWVGASHKRKNELGALAGLKIQEKYSVAYAYEIGSGTMYGYGGTHELQISLNLGEKRNKKYKIEEFTLDGHEAKPRFLNETDEERHNRLISLERDQFYVIYSTHKNFQDTDRNVTLLQRKKLKPEVGYNFVNNTYVVYLYKGSEMSKALKESKKLKKKYKIKNLKVTTVHGG